MAKQPRKPVGSGLLTLSEPSFCPYFAPTGEVRYFITENGRFRERGIGTYISGKESLPMPCKSKKSSKRSGKKRK